MSLTTKDVEARLVRWLRDLTGLQAIVSRTNAKRPPTPYVLVDFVSLAQTTQNARDVDWVDTAELNSEGNPQVEATALVEMDWTFQIFAYCDEPETTLAKVFSTEHMTQAQEPLDPDLVIHNLSPISQADELVNEKYERRAYMNLTLRGTSGQPLPVDVIDTLESSSLERT